MARLLFFILLGLLIDFYFYQIVKKLFEKSKPAFNRLFKFIYWLIPALILFATLIGEPFMDKIKGPNVYHRAVFAVFVLFFVPKLIGSFFLLLEDLYRVIKLGFGFAKKWTGFGEKPYLESRRRFISQGALTLASLPFMGILHGITLGKYNYQVSKVTLKFKELPKAFDGFTITQISDIHVGSFDSVSGVVKGINLANEQASDLLVFTGDLVNIWASEMDPWIEHFNKLTAPFGKFSILGNHDYPNARWSPGATDEQREENFKNVINHHSNIGFKLLRNEHVSIEKDGEKITLIGVENWGKPPFPQFGDLDKSLDGISPSDFKVLMSHDPSHWDQIVKKHPVPIQLTLSGHTHGMQFGIDIPWVKWSPVKYMYHQWAGLYEEFNRYLYVNKGFGFLGFPGRVGMFPEITVIQLEREI